MTFATKATAIGPLLEDGQDVCEALADAATRASILITTLDNGKFRVLISYGDVDRDERVEEAFDDAEYGIAESLPMALRFALGAHYHQETE